MPRFFCASQDVSAGKIIISNKEQVHHIRDVLRLKVKEGATICDETGREFDCLVEAISDKITLKIVKTSGLDTQRQKVNITVGCAIPKKSKFDDIVDKLTQLGVTKIIPLLTERVIVKWDARKRASQQKRWEKIALNAAQQSQRSILPIIEPVKKIEEVLKESAGYDLKLIPVLIDERKPLRDILAQASPKNILILIGPEGDFTPDEVALAKAKGFVSVTLGDNVLRVDTAAIAVVSYLRLFFLP